MKLMIIGRRRAGITLAEAHRYMLAVHGTAVVGMICEQPELAPRRYIQNHVFDGSYRLGVDRNDFFALNRDFVTQVWFDHPQQAAAAMQAPFYLSHLQPDEDRFVDQDSVIRLPVRELQVRSPLGAEGTEGAGRRRSTSKLFVFHRAGEGVSGEDLAAATTPLWDKALQDFGNAIDTVVRNIVLRRDGLPAAADVVDEVWLRDDQAARALGQYWIDQSDAATAPDALAAARSSILLTHQHVLFAGDQA
jgi:hypothetical protein